MLSCPFSFGAKQLALELAVLFLLQRPAKWAGTFLKWIVTLMSKQHLNLRKDAFGRIILQFTTVHAFSALKQKQNFAYAIFVITTVNELT